MSTSDSITEPVQSPAEYYPERWLATGQAYEFSSRPTVDPPPKFFEEFREIVGDESPLGLFLVDEHGPKTRTEVVQGRKSVTSPGIPSDEAEFIRKFVRHWYFQAELISENHDASTR